MSYADGNIVQGKWIMGKLYEKAGDDIFGGKKTPERGKTA